MTKGQVVNIWQMIEATHIISIFNNNGTTLGNDKKKCPDCGMEIPSSAKVCPFCRREFSDSLGANIHEHGCLGYPINVAFYNGYILVHQQMFVKTC